MFSIGPPSCGVATLPHRTTMAAAVITPCVPCEVQILKVCVLACLHHCLSQLHSAASSLCVCACRAGTERCSWGARPKQQPGFRHDIRAPRVPAVPRRLMR